jgi:cell division protein FtsB
MTRKFDRKEKERNDYIQEHAAKRTYSAELNALREENEKLQAKVAKLEKKIKDLKSK